MTAQPVAHRFEKSTAITDTLPSSSATQCDVYICNLNRVCLMLQRKGEVSSSARLSTSETGEVQRYLAL